MRLKIERYDNAGIKDFWREADQDDLGWGAGKRVVVYIPEVQEAELMYKLFDLVSGNLEEVNEYLDRMY